MGGCCSSHHPKKFDIDKYSDFHDKPPPAPTNQCDSLYLHMVGEFATFGLGACHTPQALFSALPGVLRTRVGYAGGSIKIKNFPDPNKIADHTEVVDIEYDPTKTTYRELVEKFAEFHDPTEKKILQYHSRIYYHNKSQKREAEEWLMDLDRLVVRNTSKNVRTTILSSRYVFPAKKEDQHFYLQQDEVLSKFANCTTPQELMYSHLAAKLNGFIGGNASLDDLEEVAEDLCLPSDILEYLTEQIKMAATKEDIQS